MNGVEKLISVNDVIKNTNRSIDKKDEEIYVSSDVDDLVNIYE